ncbi:MAG: DoxX family protein [Acidobacteria bacterium]|nr:DoxX family protein [Acidobacteriota bacterium]MBI3664227.1 DoxX family protein [Acidobacteriota bacterium]
MNFLEKLKPVGLLLLRWGLGVIFFYSGYPMLFGDSRRIVEFFGSIGLPAYLVYVAGAIELFGGCLLIAGLFTRIAGLLLTVVMAVAIWKAHMGKGVLAVNEYAYPLALAVGAFALATCGAGAISLDKLIFRDKA